MKNLKEYLNEGLITRKVSTKTPIRYTPKNSDELIDNIVELLKKGITDLNCIDVSKIIDMSWLFRNINKQITFEDIDISEWDVSNVEDMAGMFWDCNNLNVNISNWDVSNVVNMSYMFWKCKEFNSDLSKWDVSNVKWMNSMFYNCNEFNADLSKWNISNIKDMSKMFYCCDTLKKNNKIPKWYKGSV